MGWWWLAVVAFAALVYNALAPSLALHPVDLTNKRFLVTGCSITGIGYETAAILEEWNATVLCSMRSKDKANELLAAVAPRLKARKSTGSIRYALVDFTSFASVRAFAVEVLASMPRIDGVVLNAGLHLGPAHGIRTSLDGLDEELQTNHYSQFLLLRLLEERIVQSAPGPRVVFVSSGAMAQGALVRHVYEHTQRPQRRGGMQTYQDSKLMNVLSAKAFAERFAQRQVNVTVNSVAPGLVRTNFTETGKGEAIVEALAFMSASRSLVACTRWN